MKAPSKVRLTAAQRHWLELMRARNFVLRQGTLFVRLCHQQEDADTVILRPRDLAPFRALIRKRLLVRAALESAYTEYRPAEQWAQVDHADYADHMPTRGDK